MKGLEINYNFNRKHMALDGKTPAEVAIPNLKLGINKWLDLIKLCKRYAIKQKGYIFIFDNLFKVDDMV